MVDSPCTTEGGPNHETDLETTVPQRGLRAALDTCREGKKETPREARRKDWQRKKIQDSRLKTRSTQDTAAEDQHDLEGPRLPASQAQTLPSKAQAAQAVAGSQKFPFDRTPDEWKIICELKLCARCLTKTCPPHKPGDKRAPCKGSQGVPYDAKEIAAIRRSLKKDANMVWLKTAQRHTLAKGMNHSKSEQPLYAPSTNNKHESFHGVASRVPHSESGNSQRSQTLFEGSSLTAWNPASYAPLYNLQISDSFVRASTGTGPNSYLGTTPSRSSATHVDGSTGVPSPERSQFTRMIRHVGPHLMTPSRLPVDRSLDMMGLTPTTPSTTGPTFFIEEDLGIIDQDSHNIANIPVSESSGRAPRSDAEDWDSKTKVSEGIQVLELGCALDDGLSPSSSSRAVIEMLIRDRMDYAQLVAERSDTAPAQYCSIGGSTHSESEWDGASHTLVDEPQELLQNDVLVKREVLRPVQSVESFFTFRRCAS